MTTFLIGIDDTDNDTSPGTGQLARRLAREIEQRGARTLGITRHQFLLDDRIPYSTHNSGACIGLEWDRPIDELFFTFEMIATWSAEGSDPGMCAVSAQNVPPEIMQWGWAATREVLTQSSAIALASAYKIPLKALGGTGDGMIGALASVGLRADGNEGRFLDLPGIRDLEEVVTERQLTDLGIEVSHQMTSGAEGGNSPSRRDNARYITMNWVRPRLVQGKPVWPVEWSEHEQAWIPVDRKKSRPLE
jgi:tRNA(Ile2) C34 agmatinyltransferase TiaS